MSYSLGNKIQRKIFFEGNSLFNYDANSTPINQSFYVPQGIYNGRTYSSGLAYQCYAVGGQQQTTINSNLSVNIIPFIRQGDVIFLWEGTNDLNIGGLTGLQAYNNVLTYANAVIPLGVKLIVGTVLARDKTTDAADLMTRIGDYNTLLRNNAASVGYTVCDFAADTHFDERADASNATYYNADKVHLIQAGYDIIISMGITTLNAILNS
jgi:hypothetical protein